MPRPTRGAQDAAKRALAWVDAGYGGDGLTRTGLARANQLANGRNISEDTIQRMRSFFARHSSNRANSYDLRDGEPTPWRVAWDLWGGDAGRQWVEQKKFER